VSGFGGGDDDRSHARASNRWLESDVDGATRSRRQTALAAIIFREINTGSSDVKNRNAGVANVGQRGCSGLAARPDWLSTEVKRGGRDGDGRWRGRCHISGRLTAGADEQEKADCLRKPWRHNGFPAHILA